MTHAAGIISAGDSPKGPRTCGHPPATGTPRSTSAKLVSFVGDAKEVNVRRVSQQTAVLPMHANVYPVRPGASRPPDEDETIRRYGIIVREPGREVERETFAALLPDLPERPDMPEASSDRHPFPGKLKGEWIGTVTTRCTVTPPLWPWTARSSCRTGWSSERWRSEGEISTRRSELNR